jgi:hypothetical protein
VKGGIVVDGEFGREVDFSAVALHGFNGGDQEHPRNGLPVQGFARHRVQRRDLIIFKA